MKIEKEIRQTEIFKAPDGAAFLSEKEAQDYIDLVLKRKKNIRYYAIHHSPDLTEGRGMYGLLLVAIEKDWGHKDLVELFCEQTFGSRIGWVMGCSPTTNWYISDIKEEYFNNWQQNYAQVGDYKYPAKRLFISNQAMELEGYPNKLLKMPTREHEKYQNYKDYIEEVKK